VGGDGWKDIIGGMITISHERWQHFMVVRVVYGPIWAPFKFMVLDTVLKG
jgi:hypothetical protein